MKRLRLFMIFALLCAVAQGAWAQTWTEVSTADALKTAVQTDGANIKFAADISIGSTLEISGNKTVTINLAGHTLNRGCTSRGSQVIGVFSGSTLNISNGTLTGGWGGDGGILNQATLNMTSVTISGNTADDRGGGISNNGTLTMTDCTVKNNTSNDNVSPAGGGGIFNYEGKTATLTNCTITGNKASTYGGGGICNYGTMTLNNCSVTNNSANTTGGGIWNGNRGGYTGTLYINGCTITGNSAVSYGDGIYIDNSTLNMQGLCKVTGNTDSNIYLYGSDTKITVTGAFTSGSRIGLGVTDYGRKLTSGYSTYNSGHDPSEFFSMDNYMYGIGEKDGEAYPGISYVERSWVWNDEGDETKGGYVVEETKVCVDYTDYDGGKDVNTGWYLLSGSPTYENRIACHGDVKFILQDGSETIFDNGIHIDNPKYLTIYGQRDDTGKIKVYGNGKDDNAGIGGNDGYMGGYLTIHGGYIWVRTGGNNAAAIGGGEGHNSGMQSITIYGGTIDAKGQSSGAGIGCGEHNDNLPDVTIYGGTVTAEGGKNGAGIGGSEDCGNGTIKIYGGTVNAIGGKYAAGIGSGSLADMNNPIKIYGGTVTATGGGSNSTYGAGIGAAYGGNNNSTIEIRGGKVYAYGADNGAGIGGGSSYNSGGGAARELDFDFDDDDNSNVVKAALSRANTKLAGGKGGNIYIFDGYVEAYSGTSGAGIGDGYNRVASSNVYIYGGTVKVKVDNNDGNEKNEYIGSGDYNSGARSFDRGFDSYSEEDDGGEEAAQQHALSRTYEYSRLTLADNMCVSSGSTKVSASKRGETCMSSPSDDSVVLTVEVCDHSGCSYSIRDGDANKHNRNCSYCSAGGTEDHSMENGACTKCGYGSGSYTLSFYESNATGNGYGTATTYTMGKGVSFTLPECTNVPDKMMFMGWKKVTSSETAPTTIEADDSELSSLKAAGTSITISADMDGDRYYARYQTCWEGDGTGALDDPFLVKTTSDWNYIATKVSGGYINYSGKYFKMTADIGTDEAVTTMIGEYNSSKYFGGNFNGDGHTLTFNISGSSQGMAPFGNVRSATIRNLVICGSIENSAKFASGLIGSMKSGTTTISNCRVHATVNNTKGGDGTSGGFVANIQGGTVNFTRCIFDGKLSGSSTQGWGGYVGWNAGGAKVNFTNCLFKPDANSDVTDGCTFARCNTASDMTITNSYYTQSFGTAQGTQAYTVESYDSDKMWLYYGQLETDEEDEAIAALEYRENEVFVFDTGLLFQKIFYTGGTTAVTFTPIMPSGIEATGVTAVQKDDQTTTTGTLVDNKDGSYTLTMSQANAVINTASLIFYDTSANTEKIEANEDKTMNVTICGRKLYKDGNWNTLCLPFNVTSEQINAQDGDNNYTSPLHGATIMELDVEGKYDADGNPDANGSYQTSFASDGTLFLYFKVATEIEAGKPYIVKWASGTTITDPQFSSSGIKNIGPGTVESADRKVKFIGNYNPLTLTGGDKSNLYLGNSNSLYYPSVDKKINSFRAYFNVDLSSGSQTSNSVRAFVLNFGGDEETTGITTTNYTNFTNSDNAWYDMQGRKVARSASPLGSSKNGQWSMVNGQLKKGLYIYNGKKVVIK